METPYTASGEVHVLPSHVEIPGLGLIPVNAFLLRGSEPLLVDTGVFAEREAFFATLCKLIDPADLRWLWLTHADPDHMGSVYQLLEAAPGLRVITTFIGAGKLTLYGALPMERLYLLNPEQSIDIGDRRLTAIKPPIYDAPETMGLLDSKSGTLISADCFGAVLSTLATDARQIPEDELAERQILWATVDAPWLSGVDRTHFANALNRIRALAPTQVLSSHLPIAPGMLERFLDTIARVPDQTPFVGPDQAAVQQMLAQAPP